jgi:hypothetical protein
MADRATEEYQNRMKGILEGLCMRCKTNRVSNYLIHNFGIVEDGATLDCIELFRHQLITELNFLQQLIKVATVTIPICIGPTLTFLVFRTILMTFEDQEFLGLGPNLKEGTSKKKVLQV